MVSLINEELVSLFLLSIKDVIKSVLFLKYCKVVNKSIRVISVTGRFILCSKIKVQDHYQKTQMLYRDETIKVLMTLINNFRIGLLQQKIE